MTAAHDAALNVWRFAVAHRWFGYAAAAGAGAVATLALPSIHYLPLLMLAFPALLLLLRRCSGPGQAFFVGWWFGLAHFVAGLYWIANALLVEGSGFAWAVPLAAVALPAVLAVFTGLSGGFAYVLMRRGWRPVPALAIAWTMGELLRGHLFTGFPWNPIGSVWAVSDAMSQSAWLIGTYGLGFLTVLVAASAHPILVRGWRTPVNWLPLAAGAALLAAMAGFGLVRLDAETRFHPDVALRIVQANIPQSEKWSRARRDDHFITHLRLSEDRKERIDIFVWPETAVAYFLEEEPSRRALIGRFLPEDAVLITGAPRLERENGVLRRLWNSMFMIDSTGRVLATYDKTHLVPFGEYLPMRPMLQLFGLDKLVYGPIDYSPGNRRPVIERAGVPAFTPLICYEIIFPGAVIGDTAGAQGGRPQWLLNLTNDAWYGDTTGPRQHLTSAKLRAIEEGLSVVRAAGTGISAVFDAHGRRVGGLGYDARGVFDTYLPQAAAPGPFARFGNWLVLALLLAAAAVASWRRDRRHTA